MESPPFSFRAALVSEGIGDMRIQVVPVPPPVVRALGGQPNQRVLATLNGHPLRRGLLPRADGSRYLLLGQLVCRRLGFRVGDALLVTLAPDPHPDQVDLSDELTEGLDAWPEAAAAFARLTPGRQRGIAYRIDSAKRPETRLQRAMHELEQLARMG
ncbi:MAG: YdeI/OmpD-associated family protein [Hymenobacter sp.]|nr:YdeI/OmpD-associated family protein [Hymenobacter sp.]